MGGVQVSESTTLPPDTLHGLAYFVTFTACERTAEMGFPVLKAEVLVTFITPVGLLNRDLVAAGHALHHFCHFRTPKDGLLETS